MTDTPPNPSPSSAPLPPEPVLLPQSDGKLRVVSILVMIVSILGLIGTGFCALGFMADGFMGSGVDVLWMLLIAAPPLLFFVGCIWVCSELLKRLKK